MLKAGTNNSYHGGSDAGVAANSLVLTSSVFILKTGNTISKAVATGVISGVNYTVGTFAADNETVGKKTVEFTPANLGKRYIIDIEDGVITEDDEGTFYDLKTENIVDGTLGSATSGQVLLVRAIGTTKGEFTIANT